MKFNRLFVFFLLFFLGAFFCLGGKKEAGQEKSSQEDLERSLVRKELLIQEKKKLAPPKRNIFSLQSYSLENRGEETAGVNLSRGGTQTKPQEERAESALALDLRYIGYIDSGQKIIALVIFEGEALAVEAGEMVTMDVKIEKITQENIVVVGLDAQQRTYALEGETK